MKNLNAPTKSERIKALRELMALHRSGELATPPHTIYVNNHIHTTYSFSPYSPAMAAYKAWEAGLETAGIMDHDSAAGAAEFIEAGEIIGIATTAGFECRCDLRGTPFETARVNNPDQNGVAYLAMHGIPHQNICRAQEFLTPYREKRNIRNRRMTDNLNAILGPLGLALDFDADVAAISQNNDGGSITERHILYAAAHKIIAAAGKGEPLVQFLEEKLNLSPQGKTRGLLLDEQNPMTDYYLLGLLKSSLIERIYIPATDECPPVVDFIALAEELGAIAAYAYLGDVGDSVTGDKKAQKFEDDFLDELFDFLVAAGFRAVTYMPTRNTMRQLERVMELCERHGLFQISGEDINSPFQSFRCAALEKPEFRHLAEATWALIGHEKAATANVCDGMFSPGTTARLPQLAERAALFAEIGRRS